MSALAPKATGIATGRAVATVAKATNLASEREYCGRLQICRPARIGQPNVKVFENSVAFSFNGSPHATHASSGSDVGFGSASTRTSWYSASHVGHRNTVAWDSIMRRHLPLLVIKHKGITENDIQTLQQVPTSCD